MIKLKSQQELGAWLACLRAAASARGLSAGVCLRSPHLAELADSLYASLTARTKLATASGPVYDVGSDLTTDVPNRGCYANAGGELEWVDRLGAVTTCRLMASGGDE